LRAVIYHGEVAANQSSEVILDGADTMGTIAQRVTSADSSGSSNSRVLRILILMVHFRQESTRHINILLEFLHKIYLKFSDPKSPELTHLVIGHYGQSLESLIGEAYKAALA
jgi:hypothetical protein